MRLGSALILLGLGCSSASEEDTSALLDDDGDGLSNGEEESIGTDPSLPDTDADGYSDAQEVHAGTDPLDEEDVIYTGGWPYNMDKESIEDPGWESSFEEGATLPRFVGVDQFGQEVDVYDLAGQGVPIAIDMSTEWCAPCNALSAWLDGETDALEGYDWWDEDYQQIPALVAEGDILWLTILYEDSDHNDADAALAARWYEAYPHPSIPVLVDSEKLLHSYFQASGIPCVNLMDPDMRFLTHSQRGLEDAFDLLVELYSEG
jgi:thiol-disulfide isomerase/thioredoxin